MEIVQERLEREYDLNMITTAPSVIYNVHTLKGDVISIDNPSNLPPIESITSIEEPVVKATILVPAEYVGAIMELNQEKRGTYLTMDYVSKSRVKLIYELPLSEIVFDYFDQLKSRTKGYASCLLYTSPSPRDG